MDVRAALKDQYHASLAMLRQCVELCPDDLWVSGTHPRTFWRIAFHAAFFTHLYLGQNHEALRPWPGRRDDLQRLWDVSEDIEPYELPEELEPCRQKEILDYIAFVDGLVDPTVDALDLDTQESGFSWYKNISKLSHQILNIRHVQGHMGQLSELLMGRGIDIDWVSRRPVV